MVERSNVSPGPMHPIHQVEMGHDVDSGLQASAFLSIGFSIKVIGMISHPVLIQVCLQTPTEGPTFMNRRQLAIAS